MNDNLKIELKNIDDNHLEVTIHGQIDEDSIFDEIINNKVKNITIDFENIKLINSCGVREWINFLEKMTESTIVYKNCPQIVVEQINMVHGFLGPKTKIESFFAPYYSEQKDEVLKILLTTDQVVEFKAPEIERDGEVLEFDAIEAQYFQFLKQQV